MERICIEGGLVYDGTPCLPSRADILVENGRIAALGHGFAGIAAKRIDARGCVVTPGFVDMHRHCDAAALRQDGFGTIELAQGITTAVGGNCGLAPVPAASDGAEQAFYEYIEPVTGPIPRNCGMTGYHSYVQALKAARLPMNMGFLAAAGAIRYAVKGFSKEPLTAKETARAAAYVEEAMAAGACGVSLGIMYRPECYTTPQEYDAILAPAARRGGILCTHIRGEGDSLVASVQEVIDIAARAGMPLNISHFKATGVHNWGKAIFRAIECIEAARAKGQPVTADFYPYDGGSTTLLSLLPPSLLESTPDLRVFGTRAGCDDLRAALKQQHPGWDNMAQSIGWERIRISSAALEQNRAAQGKSVAKLAQEWGMSEPADVVARLLAEENGRTGVIVMSMDWMDVRTVAALPYTALISDALYGGGGSPHPRLYGAFPRFLHRMVQQDALMPMEQAIHKMTAMPAQRMGLVGRGRIAPGYAADLAVFAPEEFCDTATYADPCRLAQGLRQLLVNGTPVLQDGAVSARSAGRFVSRG